MRVKSELTWSLFAQEARLGDAVRVKAAPARSQETTRLVKRTLRYALLTLVFFLLGLLPAWVQGRATAGRLAEMEQTLRLADMQSTLIAAVIHTQQGEYEPARQAASNFYVALEAELDRGAGSAFSPAQQAALLHLLEGRDDLIALLARDDPAAATQLSDLYLSATRVVE